MAVYNLTAAAGETGRRKKVFEIRDLRDGTAQQGLRLKVKPGVCHYDVSVFWCKGPT